MAKKKLKKRLKKLNEKMLDLNESIGENIKDVKNINKKLTKFTRA